MRKFNELAKHATLRRLSLEPALGTEFPLPRSTDATLNDPLGANL
jgi:hypothetical protein